MARTASWRSGRSSAALIRESVAALIRESVAARIRVLATKASQAPALPIGFQQGQTD